MSAMSLTVNNCMRAAVSGSRFGSSPLLGLILRCNVGRGPRTTTAFSRSISGKTMRGNEPLPAKPPPFPYKEKRFGYWYLRTDTTSKRFDENTKIIVVEGSVAAGKTTLAKALAEEFEMLFVREADMDLEYKNDYGYDVRDYKHLISGKLQPFDLSDFYANPHHENVTTFQMRMYKHRYYQYIDVLQHIFNTGQGVVMDRCVYSDFCFVETMVKHGYMGEDVKRYYYDIRKNSMTELLKPHLIVYLDVPVDVLLERIKKRGVAYEQDTSVLTPEYLQTLADVYKNQYLKDLGKHAELLVYDWSKFGDPEMVIEDIERIDFDRFDKYDLKMRDWRFRNEQAYGTRRFYYTTQKFILHSYLNVPLLNVPELFAEGHDVRSYDDVWKTMPGNEYSSGFNSNLGDKNLIYKLK